MVLPSEVTVRGCSLSLGIKQVVQPNGDISEGWETHTAYSWWLVIPTTQPDLNKPH